MYLIDTLILLLHVCFRVVSHLWVLETTLEVLVLYSVFWPPWAQFSTKLAEILHEVIQAKNDAKIIDFLN